MKRQIGRKVIYMPNIRNSLSKGVEVVDGRYGGRVRMPIWWVR